ncbi:hypothetical protein DPEC_G00269450 [Dallia pectoralis]|uniref:Uncharacterized protein n=1 Tax=Dallia pectoralis TaxID=75939 RepID=A0ACC2FPA2_DALPE|nr:hypothetical protein DPEC_G00269450 [Dallia pectoralis]
MRLAGSPLSFEVPLASRGAPAGPRRHLSPVVASGKTNRFPRVCFHRPPSTFAEFQREAHVSSPLVSRLSYRVRTVTRTRGNHQPYATLTSQVERDLIRTDAELVEALLMRAGAQTCRQIDST